MTRLETSASTEPETLKGRELTIETLETVSGGGGKGATNQNSAGQVNLVFNFKLVAVKTVSWAY